jgi:hypothetical protein
MTVYDHAAAAPVTQGQVVGKLQITAPDMTEVDAPLIAAQPVAKVGALARAGLAAGYLLFGHKN